MANYTCEKSTHVCYQEIIEELAELSDRELYSYCLTSSDKQVIQTILDYKDRISDKARAVIAR